MSEARIKTSVYANGEWHPMPMTPEDAARLLRERDEALEKYEAVEDNLFEHQRSGIDGGFVACNCGWEGQYSDHPKHISEMIINSLNRAEIPPYNENTPT